MRVIAGIAKGRSLKSITGDNTRPTTDKVKEALFSILTPYLNEGLVLDLFAGTGGLGIEALSRGMSKAIFIDHNKNSIEAVVHNINHCNFADRAEVYRNDAQRALKVLKKREIRFDLIFIDPPYKQESYVKLIDYLGEHRMVNDKGVIVAEHDARLELPNSISSFFKIKHAVYGTIGLTIYQNDEEVSV